MEVLVLCPLSYRVKLCRYFFCLKVLFLFSFLTERPDLPRKSNAWEKNVFFLAVRFIFLGYAFMQLLQFVKIVDSEVTTKHTNSKQHIFFPNILPVYELRMIQHFGMI